MTSTTTVVEISAGEFARLNKGLVKLLKAVEKAGDDGIPTRRLLNSIHTIGYGEVLIKRAESLGYIRREERDPPSGTGFHPKYNILTPKGRQLLQKL